ncbi:MAG: hypothetical protein U0768_13845 [Anaerolineae bacterium]
MEQRPGQAHHFALCINNEGHFVSLVVGKLYRIIADADAAGHGYIRVVDESGEDYAYSAERFFPLELPLAIEEALIHAV